MKKNSIIIPVLFCFITACTDFLDYNENSDYTREQLYNLTWGNFEMVNAIYTYLPGSLDDEDGALRSSGCDESEYVWPSSRIHRFYDGSWSALRTVDDKWGYYYQGIRACNDYLENGTGLSWESLKYRADYETLMRKYHNQEWEVKLLRAFFYFELVKRYNNIPLITKMLTEEEANEQVPVDYQTIIRFIVESCDEVVPQHAADSLKLPVQYDERYGNENGRLTRAAAYSLKARALLYDASPLNNPQWETDPSKWIAAAEAAKVVLDSASAWNISIAANFSQITGSANFSAPEIILAKRLGTSNEYERRNFPIGVEGGFTGNCPTHNLAKLYSMRRGQTVNPDNIFQNRDSRLDNTVLYHGARTAYGLNVDISQGGANGLPQEGATRTGYYMRKFINNNVSLTSLNTTEDRHSLPLFRLPELYLIYAEAMNEVYGPEGTGDGSLNMSARTAINRVRARGSLFISNLTAADVPDKETFRQKLREERMMELAFEDHRFWDIRRWKIGPETTKIERIRIMDKTDGSEGFDYEIYSTDDRIWEDKMYFYPIPQSELYKNSKLIQNPGWEIE